MVPMDHSTREFWTLPPSSEEDEWIRSAAGGRSPNAKILARASSPIRDGPLVRPRGGVDRAWFSKTGVRLPSLDPPCDPVTPEGHNLLKANVALSCTGL